jgi:23S rRNA (adenine2503-C2)-methyltransferase
MAKTTPVNTSVETTSTSRQLLTDLTRDELAQWCVEHEESTYRADQIRRWLFGKRVNDFEAMHDLPARLRAQLSEQFELFSSVVVEHQVAEDRTEKLLLRHADGEHTECVLMRETNRRTVCVSTQVGCAMGCVFCASGLFGLKRNLSTGEILEQILRLDRLLAEDERITNVVVMGIGEPLANLISLLPALITLNEKGGMGLGARRITISTVGLPEKIRELAAVGKAFNLAISLHAPNDELRNELVPVNQNVGLNEIMKAADDYFDTTGRRVTYEYVLLGGINDQPQHARQLAAVLRSRNAHVNLIPMNSVTELPFKNPSRPKTKRFVELLEENGVNVTVRKRKGADIDAACGQLRLQQENGGEMQGSLNRKRYS